MTSPRQYERGMFRAAMSLKTAASASTLLCTSETSANLLLNRTPSSRLPRSSTPPELDHSSHRVGAAFHDHLDLLAGPAGAEGVREVIDVVDRLAVQFHQDVLRLQARGLGGAPGRHPRELHPARVRPVRRDGPEPCAVPALRLARIRFRLD